VRGFRDQRQSCSGRLPPQVVRLFL
jgi:hypothetical protein